MDEGTQLRGALLSDANAAAYRKLIDPASLNELNGPIGFRNIASDLQILAAVFEKNWDKLQGKTPTTQGEVQRALEIAASILQAVGIKERSGVAIAATSDIRARAFTLFTRVYDEVRRVVSYLRWHNEDVDVIAPSLYAGRGHKKQPSQATDVPPRPAPAPAPAPAASAAAMTPAHEEPTQAPPGTAVKQVAGMPGSGPFVDK